MSSFDRRTCLVFFAALGACGFEPAYAPGRLVSDVTGATEFAPPKNRDGFDFVAQLERRLGRSESALYRLDWSLSVTSRGQAISATEETRRTEFTGTAKYSLTRLSDGEVVAEGEVRAVTGFAEESETAAAQTNQIDARRRLMVILADNVVTRLLGVQ